MGQILSNSEVEAILSALDFTLPTPAAKSLPAESVAIPHVAAYDFAHPTPLRSSQLEGLRLASAAAAQSIQDGLARSLRSAVIVNFLGIEQSTYSDYLKTSEQPGCLAVLSSAVSGRRCLLDISRTLAFTFIDCLLGGTPAATQPTVTISRPFTELESRLIDKVVQVILPDLTGWPRTETMRMTQLASNPSTMREAERHEAVALTSYEVICGSIQGMIQLCVPWQQIAEVPQSLTQEFQQTSAESHSAQQRLRKSSVKIPVVATATISTFPISARDLANLSPGDVLLTDVSASGEMRLEIDGREVFRGVAGQSRGRKVIRLTTPIVPSQERAGP